MRTVAKKGRKGKKQRVLREVEILSPEQYEQMALDARVETIQALIPLGLWHIGEELKKEVEQLAGRRHERVPGGKALVRYGHNPGSVPLGGQRIAIQVPRIRNQHTHREVPLESYGVFTSSRGRRMTPCCGACCTGFPAGTTRRRRKRSRERSGSQPPRFPGNSLKPHRSS